MSDEAAPLPLAEWGFCERNSAKTGFCNAWAVRLPSSQNIHFRLMEIYNNSRKIWRNSIHFGVSVTFVLFGMNVQPRLLRWTQMELPPRLNAWPPPTPHFQDKSHPLKEYDSALNVLPEILMSGPIARFHCNKCWYTFMWWSCLHSWGCFSAGSTINSFKGRSELNQTDIYHQVMEDT